MKNKALHKEIEKSLTDGSLELGEKLEEIMNHYRCSDGTKVTKSHIDREIRKAKKRKIADMLFETGYIFCEDCTASSGVYIDCSHDISVDECQKSGRSELAWDVNNITLRCRDCHKKHDKNLILKG